MQMQESTSLRGRVRVEPDGRAVGGAIVRASWPAAGTEPQEATTGIDGTFEFADAPSAPAVLLVLPPLDGSTNLMPKRIDVTGTTSDLDVVVRPGATISGRVVDSDRNPLAGAMVSASMSGGMDSASVISAITNERGGFELVGLEARDYDLEAASRRAISTATKSSIATGETRVTLLLDTSRDADRSR